MLSMRNLFIAFLLHVGAFAFFFAVACLQNLFKPKETVIPIELEIVVNENLDGKIDEPPPLANPAQTERPKIEPKRITEKKIPEASEKLDAVVKVKEKDPPKKDPPKKDPPQKPDPPKKNEPPKKTKEEIRKERLERMRNAAKATRKKVEIEVKDAPSGDGRTERRIHNKDEIYKHLMGGAKPGSINHLATNERQRCVSLIQMALRAKWKELSPSIDREGTVSLTVQITEAGRLVNCRIVRSCGGQLSDKAVLSVASSVGVVRGLSREFIDMSRRESLTINYEVERR